MVLKPNSVFRIVGNSGGEGGGFNTWWFMADVEYEPRNCEMFRNVLSTTTPSFSIIRFTFRRRVKRAILRPSPSFFFFSWKLLSLIGKILDTRRI